MSIVSDSFFARVVRFSTRDEVKSKDPRLVHNHLPMDVPLFRLYHEHMRFRNSMHSNTTHVLLAVSI